MKFPLLTGEATKIMVSGSDGKILYRATFQRSDVFVDLGYLEPGLYYLQAILPGGYRVTKKIVKD